MKFFFFWSIQKRSIFSISWTPLKTFLGSFQKLLVNKIKIFFLGDSVETSKFFPLGHSQFFYDLKFFEIVRFSRPWCEYLIFPVLSTALNREQNFTFSSIIYAPLRFFKQSLSKNNNLASLLKTLFPFFDGKEISNLNHTLHHVLIRLNVPEFRHIRNTGKEEH